MTTTTSTSRAMPKVPQTKRVSTKKPFTMKPAPVQRRWQKCHPRKSIWKPAPVSWPWIT
ncbi:hypothetical protein BDR07DRAFT_1388723 [Suillus spraguei]|nr:hypothetical protein BDR07DRAFT_1388723 [Suillus spraguei]